MHDTKLKQNIKENRYEDVEQVIEDYLNYDWSDEAREEE